MTEQQIDSLLADVKKEILKAREKHGDHHFHSKHEGYAVMREEVDELWEAIRHDNPGEHVRMEATQVAAMAVRIMGEVCHD